VVLFLHFKSFFRQRLASDSVEGQKLTDAREALVGSPDGVLNALDDSGRGGEVEDAVHDCVVPAYQAFGAVVICWINVRE